MGLHTVGAAALSALVRVPVRRVPARSGSVHRTGAPVLRDSVEAGSFEEAFFRIPGKGEPDRMLATARKAVDAGKELRRAERAGERLLTAFERHLARLTFSAVRVFEELAQICRLQQGRVYPSYDYLVEKTKLSRSTIRRAIAILEDVGFIVRQRRFKRVEAEGAGPRYAQTSNAYRLLLPKSILSYLPRWLRPPPLPIDEECRKAGEIEQTQAMLATLTSREFAETIVSGPLGKALARLGASLDRHEREVQS